MLYRGSEIIREVAWVVYDEIHYMRDSERGVVWEESIILLPDAVRYVFLSATIPNAMEFAEWICKIHQQPCHIVYTDFRPTPLQHYLFPAGGDGIHLVVDEKSRFREDNFQRAIAALSDARGDDPSGPNSRGKKGKTYKGGNSSDGPPDIYHPINNMGIKDPSFQKLVNKILNLEKRVMDHPLTKSPDLPVLYETYTKKMEITEKIKDLKRKLIEAQSIVQLEELKNRKRVLRRLGFTTSSDVVEMKGRVACEISSGDELLLTEMIFQGVFNDLTVDQSVAVLSCFVFDEKVDAKTKLQEELSAPLRLMQETARRIAKVANECKMNLDEEEYVGKFKPELMDVVFAWCQGAKFSQICKMTTVYEGSLIRVFRRLEELLRQMCAAAKSIGNSELENKFSEGINRIHRDIIFAASLYL
ncbi:Putative ATP-dependent RNA helicase [Rhizopus microsporus]|nr:Putative ATP-dependent RNA helicase [Rhizopus microsporus]